MGIIIYSSFNKRKSQRDYWSTDPYLSSQIVSSAMSRDKFESIKSKVKYSKLKDNHPNDRGWRVRAVMKLFQKNILLFGYFRTALSIDEMMVKSYARTVLKQFIKGKPIRFGLKIFSLCTSDGFVLYFDLYCGKNSAIGDRVLNKCAMGSQVVMYLLKDFLHKTTLRNISLYHLYFDNFFTSFDLVLHLKKRGLQSTGTIRENRIKKDDKIVFDKKATRGTYAVKNDKKSGINYISIIDSKQVSVASSTAGVTSLLPCRRYSSEEHSKVEIPFPRAIHLYNKYMGGVDIHDMHCNNLLPCIRAKKWTWVIFVLLIQAAITNSVVLFNAANNENKKEGTKAFALSISKYYLDAAIKNRKKPHESKRIDKQAKCSSCSIKTYKFCSDCNLYFCKVCFPQSH
ncbi:piggyBac transposable element-derived protein 3-like [Leptopilina heterotoma]|uniref:piggyBac transposable element-derived protein 3-like n=1 Tax=Leptopilina heterotoma TaxID=63436 RepID=UPI001CA9A243|nr:piggyBac transposable element-derived protein 3-like [Leptopilina heterotoma]